MKLTVKIIHILLYMQNSSDTTELYPLSYHTTLFDLFVMLTPHSLHFSTACPVEYGKHHGLLALWKPKDQQAQHDVEWYSNVEKIDAGFHSCKYHKLTFVPSLCYVDVWIYSMLPSYMTENITIRQ